jgi:hypothetical protein
LKYDMHTQYSPNRFVDLTPVSADVQGRRVGLRSALGSCLSAVTLISVATLLSASAQGILEALAETPFGLFFALFL